MIGCHFLLIPPPEVVGIILEILRRSPVFLRNLDHLRPFVVSGNAPSLVRADGRSSLLNKLFGETRSIVSEIPGTTRDSIDAMFERGGRYYRLVDTAGIRRKGKVCPEPLP